MRNHKDLSKVMERRWGRSARKNRRGRTSRRWEVRREKFPAVTEKSNRVRGGEGGKMMHSFCCVQCLFWDGSRCGSQLQQALLTCGWARVCLRKGAAGGG